MSKNETSLLYNILCKETMHSKKYWSTTSSVHNVQVVHVINIQHMWGQTILHKKPKIEEIQTNKKNNAWGTQFLISL